MILWPTITRSADATTAIESLIVKSIQTS